MLLECDIYIGPVNKALDGRDNIIVNKCCLTGMIMWLEKSKRHSNTITQQNSHS